MSSFDYPYQKTFELAKSLKKDFKLTDFEALQAANGIVNNQIFALANVIDGQPDKVALEYIGMQLRDIAANIYELKPEDNAQTY